MKKLFFQTELPNDVDIDLDEILDIEDENQRKKFIRVSEVLIFIVKVLYCSSSLILASEFQN